MLQGGIGLTEMVMEMLVGFVIGMLDQLDNDDQNSMEYWDRLNRSMFAIRVLRQKFDALESAALSDANTAVLENIL